MPTIATVTVKYGRKYPIRKDDWVNLEASVTLSVAAEEANIVDAYEVTREAFAIARQAVKEQGMELRRQLNEMQARAAEEREARQAEAQVSSNGHRRNGAH